MCWWDKHSVWWFRCTNSAEGKPVDGAQVCEAESWGFREEKNVWLSPANVNFCLYVCLCSAGKSPRFWLLTHLKHLRCLRDGALNKFSLWAHAAGEITALPWREKSQCGGKLKEKGKLHPKATICHFPLLLESWFTLKIPIICSMTAGAVSLGFAAYTSPSSFNVLDHCLGMMFTPHVTRFSQRNSPFWKLAEANLQAPLLGASWAASILNCLIACLKDSDSLSLSCRSPKGGVVIIFQYIRGHWEAGGHKFPRSAPQSASFNRMKLKQGIFSLNIK